MAIILKESATVLTAIVEPSGGKYVIACPELDLATEGDTPEAAFEDLIDMALDYAAQYMEEYELFSMSPNRAAHAPFVKVVHEMGSREKVKALLLERSLRCRKMLDKVKRERGSMSLTEYRKSRGI